VLQIQQQTGLSKQRKEELLKERMASNEKHKDEKATCEQKL
jgi:hypothetical protein